MEMTATVKEMVGEKENFKNGLPAMKKVIFKISAYIKGSKSFMEKMKFWK